MRRLAFLTIAASAACSLAYPLGDGLTSGGSASGGPLVDASTVPDSTPTTPEPDGGSLTTEPLLAYGTKTGALRTRRWLPATKRWSPPVTLLEVGAAREIRHVMPRRSLVSGRVAVALHTANAGDGASPRVSVYDFDGQKLLPVFEDADYAPQQGAGRPFDLAWDGKTGRAIAVYGGAASHIPRMRIRTDAGWGPERAAFATAPAETTFAYLELVTHPGTDDVALVYSDSKRHLWAARFDGTAFEAPVQIASLIETNDFKAFDGAYEQASGELILAWSAAASIFWTATPKGAPKISVDAGELPQSALTGPLALAADPTSDRVALASIELVCGGGDCDDFATFSWSGSAWSPLNVPDPDVTTSFFDRKASAPTTVAWLGGKAIAPYHKASDGFRWAQADGPTWVLQPEVKTNPAIGTKSSFVAFHPTANELVMLVQEASGRLWAKRYDGTTWSDTEDGLPLADDLPDPAVAHGVPFGIDVP